MKSCEYISVRVRARVMVRSSPGRRVRIIFGLGLAPGLGLGFHQGE